MLVEYIKNITEIKMWEDELDDFVINYNDWLKNGDSNVIKTKKNN